MIFAFLQGFERASIPPISEGNSWDLDLGVIY
jgi:hypothetical protein